jgi:diaminohydroxyphosphoribosylaminopyrimidine deaminase/5-amino-6-(5-phosphoribosylamino)uracil reductase
MTGDAIAIADRDYMSRALRLAARGRYTTQPNPRVGCVLAKDGEVIAEGWHLRAGGAHAEIDALANARGPVRGATAYVSLEPCSHHGRTPPCAEALVAAGIRRVVVAMEDPNPAVSGTGMALLRDAGIEVSTGLLEPEARKLNRGFISRMQGGGPFVFAKMASSLDGRTAMANGESQWITGAAARGQVQRLRASSCAIVTGVGTVLQDDPALTLRAESLPDPYPGTEIRQPLRLVLDSALRTPPRARILQQAGETIIVSLEHSEAKLAPLRDRGATLVTMPGRNGKIDLQALLRWLAEERACNEVMVESGAVLVGALLQAGLLDELQLFVAPTLMGSAARPLAQLPLVHMGEQLRLHIEDMRAVGDDWWIRARPHKKRGQ